MITNNNKNSAYKALTTEVSKRYNKQNTMINNYILKKTKKKMQIHLQITIHMK